LSQQFSKQKKSDCSWLFQLVKYNIEIKSVIGESSKKHRLSPSLKGQMGFISFGVGLYFCLWGLKPPKTLPGYVPVHENYGNQY